MVVIGESTRRGRLSFVPYIETFTTNRCFVEDLVMRADGTSILKAFFVSKRGEEVLHSGRTLSSALRMYSVFSLVASVHACKILVLFLY